MQRIGILGGSFDPIHQGHLEIALCARDQLKLDLVLFVPAACSPFKIQTGLNASDADRLEMTRLAVKGIPSFHVSDWELERGGVSYTVDTLKHFREEYPRGEFYLLMGEDAYEGFDRWKSSDEIRKMAVIAVAPRVAASNALASAKSGDLTAGMVHLKMKLYNVSSTQLRFDLSQRRDEGLRLLPKALQSYIRQHQLYL